MGMMLEGGDMTLLCGTHDQSVGGDSKIDNGTILSLLLHVTYVKSNNRKRNEINKRMSLYMNEMR